MTRQTGKARKPSQTPDPYPIAAKPELVLAYERVVGELRLRRPPSLQAVLKAMETWPGLVCTDGADQLQTVLKAMEAWHSKHNSAARTKSTDKSGLPKGWPRFSLARLVAMFVVQQLAEGEHSIFVRVVPPPSAMAMAMLTPNLPPTIEARRLETLQCSAQALAIGRSE